MTVYDSRPALLIGGPADRRIVAATLNGVHVVVPNRVSVADMLRTEAEVTFTQVHYRIGRVVMFDRIVRVGHLGSQPSGHALWHLLVSDLAKAAAER